MNHIVKNKDRAAAHSDTVQNQKINLLASFRSCDLLQAYKQNECGHTKGPLLIISSDCIISDTCVNMAKATEIGNMGNVVQHHLYQM
jgi:hypothetical protein